MTYHPIATTLLALGLATSAAHAQHAVTMTVAGNDAAICLAEGLGGNEEQFAKRMTVEARRIGLTKSTFTNPSGLYDPGHLMTAR